jgi:hypothetical protein
LHTTKNTASGVFALEDAGFESSMGKIGKQRQLNEMEWYGAVRDLGFYEMRWILKFSFKHRKMNEIKVFLV